MYPHEEADLRHRVLSLLQEAESSYASHTEGSTFTFEEVRHFRSLIVLLEREGRIREDILSVERSIRAGK